MFFGFGVLGLRGIRDPPPRGPLMEPHTVLTRGYFGNIRGSLGVYRGHRSCRFRACKLGLDFGGFHSGKSPTPSICAIKYL